MFSTPAATLLACAFTWGVLQAQPAVVVTLSSLPDRVRAQNPDLAAARFGVAEALGRMKQAGVLANPELSSSAQGGSGLRNGEWEIGITQRFPLTDRLRREKDLSVTGLRAAEIEIQEVERKLVAEASRALVEVLALRQRRVLLLEQTVLANQLSESLRASADQGEGSFLDVGQARVEAFQLEAERRQLDAREAAAVGELKPLLGMKPGEGLVVSGHLPTPELPALPADPATRPEYRLALLQTEAARQGIALEQSKRYDDASAGVFLFNDRQDSRNEGMVGIRFSLPLPFWNQNGGAIEEARARHQRRQGEAEALGNAIFHEVEAARAEMTEWAKLVDEIGTQLLPLAEQQTSQTEEAFNNGQTDLQTVLRTRARRLQLASARLDALRDFHLARIRWQAALGTF